MKQRNVSTRPLSWPDAPSTREWIIVFTVSGVMFLFIFLLFLFLSMLVGKKDSSLICLTLIQGISIGASIFAATMTLGVILLRGKSFSARTECKRISKSLGAIAIGTANCSTLANPSIPPEVVLVLTRNTFAVYGKRPFVKVFEYSLSKIVGTATYRDNPALLPDTIEITFKDDDKASVRRFHQLREIDDEEWADKIALMQQ